MTDKTRQAVAKKIREIRLKKGLTQADVAKRADADTNYYAKVERGEATPSMNMLEKIIKALGAKSSDVLPF